MNNPTVYWVLPNEKLPSDHRSVLCAIEGPDTVVGMYVRDGEIEIDRIVYKTAYRHYGNIIEKDDRYFLGEGWYSRHEHYLEGDFYLYLSVVAWGELPLYIP